MTKIIPARLPPEDAIKFFKSKKIGVSFNWKDVWQQGHVYKFVVAKAPLDIASDIFAEFDKNLESGMPYADFAKNLIPNLKKKGWWGKEMMTDPKTGVKKLVQLGSHRRLKVIYDTNLRMASATGKWQRIQKAKSGLPYLRYSAVMDGKTRPLHRQWHGIILPVDHVFWKTHFPPNGWFCRCRARQLSKYELNKNGWKVSDDPKINFLDYEDKRNGLIRRVPEGVDAGFAYNVGVANERFNQVRDLVTESLASADPNLSSLIFSNNKKAFIDFVQDGFGSFVDDVMKNQGKQTGKRKIVGFLSSDILTELARVDKFPESAALSISDREVIHFLREVKASKGNALPLDTVKNLPNVLQNHKAVLLDKRNNGLVYVFDAEEETKKGKVAVHLDFFITVKTKGKRKKIQTNTLRSGGLVSLKNLEDTKSYKLIEGSL